MKKHIAIPVFTIIVLAALSVWYVTNQQKDNTPLPLEGSGTVEAVEVIIAPEIGGRVTEVMVDKGEQIEVGDVVFQLDDQLLMGQRERAASAFETAQAGVETAKTGVEFAQAALDTAKAGLLQAQAAKETTDLQYRIALNNARAVERQSRDNAWEEELSDAFEQPVWYYAKSEEIVAAQDEEKDAYEALEIAKAGFVQILSSASSANLQAAETRLADAQAAYLVTQDVLERAQAQPDEELESIAQELFDAAESELTAAQNEYDRMFLTEASDAVKEARARVSVAQMRYDSAQDRLNAFLTGGDSLQVALAGAAISQAEAGISLAEANIVQAEASLRGAEGKLSQAEKAVAQAQAELDLIDIQIERLTIFAFTQGVVTGRNVEPGEVVQPGTAAILLSQIDSLTISVYLSEDRYGSIRLGSNAVVSVDSFPGRTFDASVIRIADKSEFTPRNVATEEGRRTTVFAVELLVENPDGELKPGMPADVVFED
ncbi:MAG: HlyD family efflux transporter periplasmic adaptor subunit [Chloroflexi bacterium]|nr:MAG: HlyD family efflux transporter periplasmic adaptor subunit [Chloroflexota bacterium]